MEVGDAARAVRPGVRRPGAAVEVARAAIRRQPPSRPTKSTSDWTTSTSPRSTRSRASAASGPSRRRRCACRSTAQRRVPVVIVGAERLLEPVDAELLERPRALRRGRARSQRGSRSPGMRQPWFASTMISSPSPTASRTASTTARSSRQSCAWKRIFTARTPARGAPGTAARARPATTSSPLEAYASSRSRATEQLPHRLAERLADEIPDGDLDRPVAGRRAGRPSRASPRTSVRRGSTPVSRRSRSARSGTPSPPRSPRPVVGVDEDDRRVLVLARDRVPRGARTAGRADTGSGASRRR